jgi:hypothetical protein
MQKAKIKVNTDGGRHINRALSEQEREERKKRKKKQLRGRSSLENTMCSREPLRTGSQRAGQAKYGASCASAPCPGVTEGGMRSWCCDPLPRR